MSFSLQGGAARTTGHSASRRSGTGSGWAGSQGDCAPVVGAQEGGGPAGPPCPPPPCPPRCRMRCYGSSRWEGPADCLGVRVCGSGCAGMWVRRGCAGVRVCADS
eukprot:6549812-Pyramimonas_sp.AAC.1